MRGLALEFETRIPQHSSDIFVQGEGTALGLLRTPEDNPQSPKVTRSSTPASTGTSLAFTFSVLQKYCLNHGEHLYFQLSSPITLLDSNRCNYLLRFDRAILL